MLSYYKNMPNGVININFVQIFSTVGYAVLMGLLNFYLSREAGMSKIEANTLTASFFGLNFLLHFLGGAVGGRYISFRALFFVSLFLQVVGLSLISIHSHFVILSGMAVFITGAGLNVSCINMMLTQLFAQNDERRRVAFSINYSFMNIGFFLSFLVAGYLQGHNLYSAAFIFAAACLFIAFILHIFTWKHVQDKHTYFSKTFYKDKRRFIIAPTIISLCLVGSYYLMYHPKLASNLIYVVFAITLFGMIVLAQKQNKTYRAKIYTYLVLTAASMIFACVQGLQSTALENFVEFNTNKSLFGIGMEPATVNMFEALGVIIFGFILASALKKRQTAKQSHLPGTLVSRGLSLYIFAFLMIPLGIYLAGPNHVVNVIFPILLLLIIAAGEVHVNAVNYALAGEMIQPHHQGIFTGYLFINIAFGINLAGPISNLALTQTESAENISAASTNPIYMKIFLVMALVAVVIAIIFKFATKKINAILKETQLEAIHESELE